MLDSWYGEHMWTDDKDREYEQAEMVKTFDQNGNGSWSLIAECELVAKILLGRQSAPNPIHSIKRNVETLYYSFYKDSESWD